MNGFNLSDWALKHRSMVWYFMLVATVAGVFSFIHLGREEDPSFTIKTMVISVQWPGATAEQVASQVTERIERKLQELETLDYSNSTSTAGLSVVNVTIKGIAPAQVPTAWLQVRNMIEDITSSFPKGISGPFYNDHFGDVYGNIYAFTADGLSRADLRSYVDDARSRVLTLDSAGRVDLVGDLNEVIYLEFSTRQLAALGISSQAVIQALSDQNAVSSSGVVQADQERISVRVGGQFSSEADLRAINLRVGDQFFRLADVATITRGYVDPPSALFRFNGRPGIGLAIGMRAGGNLLDFGKALEAEMTDIQAELPVGVHIDLVSNQPEVVTEAIDSFTRALMEAIAIVLIVSFVSLGLRAGLVVALSIPLVLAVTFFGMEYLDISLQRVSLGALIIALGLLVDDAMIAVETMVSELEAGKPLRQAAIAVYTSTAFPMLTGTMVTVFGFIPIGLNSSSAGEFTFSLFVVLAIALIVSWIVAVLFTPLIGVTILTEKIKRKAHGPGPKTRAFTRVLELTMRFRWVTIAVTLAAFGLSLYGMTFVQQQFFPASDRPELVVTWSLPQNASIADTAGQIEQFEAEALATNPDIEHFSSYVGSGAPRFVLAFDAPNASPASGQTIIVTKGIDVRDKVKAQIEDYLHTTFPGTDANTTTLSLGPPVGRPVQYRVSGPDVQTVRTLAYRVASSIGTNPNLGDIVYDWMEPARVIRVDVLQDKARQLGLASSDIASALAGVISGTKITQIQDGNYLIDVIGRAEASQRQSIDTLQNLQLSGSEGQAIPLAAVAKLSYELEQPKIIRRDRLSTLTVSAGVIGSVEPATVVKQIEPQIEQIRDSLPPNYAIDIGGTVESSAESQGPILAAVPLMLFAMATVLMIQLQSFSRLILVFAVAPLALIGVVAALLLTGRPLGFVAILGVLALVGILIRNSVILIVQIEHLRSLGTPAWNAVLQATEHRMRPILLTALAASLALIPIATEVFWGPMAVAMMGGIIVGTGLTLFFLPSLYVSWFRIRPEASDPSTAEVALPPDGPAPVEG
ncbi:MAG: efflux RND transporter permease subunit [Devosia sp.]